MFNVEHEFKDGKLIITVDPNNPGRPSKSGKTIVIASTEGNKSIDVGDQKLTVGLNIYKPR